MTQLMTARELMEFAVSPWKIETLEYTGKLPYVFEVSYKDSRVVPLRWVSKADSGEDLESRC
jgi:hypothetical protein